jgi:hypothetical protein
VTERREAGGEPRENKRKRHACVGCMASMQNDTYVAHACELSASLGPVRGKSNYSKRDRELSQSRSGPSIYTMRL